ncbi:MAG: hypothetical protein D6735_06400 [Acidobacteria bacterium]|nr:MAG: hypothetical protein D6735_06400 [Acidobacteriota bacterium]
MRETPFLKWTESRFRKVIRYFVLIAISGFVLAPFALYQSKHTTGQEKKKEQPNQGRVPDDLTDNLILPFFVYDCLDQNEEVAREIETQLPMIHNPYFVRGDFDGDGRVDYAVIVESRKTKQEGLLICFRKKKIRAVLLGLDPKKRPPFWLLMNWDVQTREEVVKIRNFKGESIGIRPKAESIVMKGEDWIGVIYWDGRKFRWKEVILNKGD